MGQSAAASITVKEHDNSCLRGAEAMRQTGPLKLWRLKGEWRSSTFEIAYHQHSDQTTSDTYLCVCQFGKGKEMQAVQRFQEICDGLHEFLTDGCPMTATQLTRLMKCLQQHSVQGQSLAHVAVHADLDHLLWRESFQQHFEKKDDCGCSPLLLACKLGHPNCLQRLIESGASIHVTDAKGNTSFHLAAEISDPCCTMLIRKVVGGEDGLTGLIDQANDYEDRPLHIACRHGQIMCVQALLAAGANTLLSCNRDGDWPLYIAAYHGHDDIIIALLQHSNGHQQLHLRNRKNGMTALHCAKSVKCIEVLLKHGMAVDTANSCGLTALHTAAQRGDFNSVMLLLKRGAPVNALESANGFTPLHLACQAGALCVVKALLAFGADLNVANHHGTSALDMAKKNPHQECAKLLGMLGTPSADHRISSSQKDAAVDVADYSLPPQQIHHRDGARVLCLDGGGTRGLVLVEMLEELESALGRPVVECFDWIAGTSTGGMLALCLVHGRKSLADARRMYFKMKDDVFHGKWPYNPAPLEKLLQDEFEEKMMTCMQTPRVVVTATRTVCRPPELHLFRNYGNLQQHGLPPPASQPVWEAARATSAAPSYFPSFKGLVDGGVIANNPTLDVLTEIQRCHQEAQGPGAGGAPISVVVSLGTGIEPAVQMAGTDFHRPQGITDVVGIARALFNIKELSLMFLDQVTSSNGVAVQRAEAWCQMMGTKYFRFSPQFTRAIDLAETDDNVLLSMLMTTKAYLQDQKRTFEKLAGLLKRQ